MNFKHRSPVWKISRDEFKSRIDKYQSIGELLLSFGLENKGGNYKTLNNRVIQEGFSLEEIKLRSRNIQNSKLSEYMRGNAKDLELILTINSKHDRTQLKSRLIKEGLLKNICAECGLADTWNGKPITIQLDHINGISNDNRLDNLRMLCPNCHSQTKTFSGKSTLKVKPVGTAIKRNKKNHFCLNCGNPCTKSKTGLCRPCVNLNRQKSNRPPIEELQKMVDEYGYSEIGRRFGVSDNSVRKWLKISQPIT